MKVRHAGYFTAPLSEADPEVALTIAGELERQRDQIELIASENIVSRAVLDAQGSIFTNKTVEGLPGARYYGGVEFADRIERIAIERARRVFDCRFANVQPHSGSQANLGTYLAVLRPGDTILAMGIDAGGHLSHGHQLNASGQHYRAVRYGVRGQDEMVDMDDVERLAREHRPKLIVAGGSSYFRVMDFARFRWIADAVGALFMVDIAHFAGLVATGLFPHPFPHAHIVTTTTYKSLRGARGGIVLTNDEALARKIDKGVFPGVQGSALLHAIAGKAVCLGEALKPEFKVYCQTVLDNARDFADALAAGGFRIVTGGTDMGLFLVDLRSKGTTGEAASRTLERAGIACNKNMIPFDPRPPRIASGLRLSTNAGTTRGFGGPEFRQVAESIARVLDGMANNPADNDRVERAVRDEVTALCRRFPIYP